MMVEKELISVVVSAYNAEATMRKCINSVLAQTYSNFELIIVDDGSIDNTGQIAEDYKMQDNRIVVIHKDNGGLTSARKQGYLLSKGEYICFIDSDDFVEDNYLSELYSLMNDDTDIVMGSYFVNNNKESYIKKFTPTHIAPRDYTTLLILPSIYYLEREDREQYPDFVWLRLYRKSVISEKCFVSERVCYTEDLFFQFYSLLNSKGVSVSDKTIYHYVVTEQSLTQKYRENKLEMVQNRYSMIEQYCLEHKIYVSDKRLNGLHKISLLGCIYNARLSNDYSKFLHECNAMYEVFCDFLCGRVKGINMKQRVVLFLMKIKWYKILYCLMGV